MQREQSRTPHATDVSRCYAGSVISISTSRFEKYGRVEAPEEAEDASGKIIIDLLTDAGHKLHSYQLVSDEIESIRTCVSDLINQVDVIITTGGTGLAPRDVTIEAIAQLVQKEIPGFGELFRLISYEQIGSSAMLTRAVGGIIENTVIFCLPGSPNAVKLAMSTLVLPELHHIRVHLSGQ